MAPDPPTKPARELLGVRHLKITFEPYLRSLEHSRLAHFTLRPAQEARPRDRRYTKVLHHCAGIFDSRKALTQPILVDGFTFDGGIRANRKALGEEGIDLSSLVVASHSRRESHDRARAQMKSDEASHRQVRYRLRRNLCHVADDFEKRRVAEESCVLDQTRRLRVSVAPDGYHTAVRAGYERSRGQILPQLSQQAVN